jgi:hypothetical protein
MKIFEEATPAALQAAFNAWVALESPELTTMKSEMGYRADKGVGKFFLMVTWSAELAPPLTLKLPLDAYYGVTIPSVGLEFWTLINRISPLGAPKGLVLLSVSTSGLTTASAFCPISYLLPNGSTVTEIKVCWQPGVAAPDTANLTMTLWSDDGTGLNYATNHGSVAQDAVATYHTKSIAGLSQVIDRGSRRHYIELTSGLNIAAPASDYVCGVDISYA